jgi:hypothetical protein
MSNFGLPSEKLKEARSKLPPIKLSSFIDPREPWVLVPDGNLLGFFHWVPKNLRIGPWSHLALPTLTLAASILVYYSPNNNFDDYYLHAINYYPQLYSNIWWYNVIGFLFMLGNLTYIMLYRTKGAIFTYTLISWMMNTIRHGINAITPCLLMKQQAVDDVDNNPLLLKQLLKINHILRFPAIASASITFVVWNAVLFPLVYNYGFDTKEKKTNFLKFNCAFRMVQQHVCNIIYAVMNTIVSVSENNASSNNSAPVLFQSDDLWRGATSIFLYGIFYLVILDRIGVHIYPIFSPRTNYVIITWCTVFLLIFGVYHFWNWVMINYWDSLLRLDMLMTLNFGIVILMSVVNKVIS